jgi:hypothetical protein
MGKGEITANLGRGQYSVTLLCNRVEVEKNLNRLNALIAETEAQLADLPAGDPDFKGPGLRLLRASLIKQKETLELIPEDQTVSAWCADLSDELSGIVGTMEINGDPDAGINIRPGYADDAAHDPERDGQLVDIRSMTPVQAFCNLAFLPGWQKWMPTYRIGEITEIEADTCSVTLDTATSCQQDLDINEKTNIDGVQIEYMECNGAAFAVGDRVIVEYRDRGLANTPVVIGFEQNPKPCGLQIKLIRGDGTPVNAALLTYLKVKDSSGAYQAITYELYPDTGYWKIEPDDPLDDPLKYWIEYKCTDGLAAQYPGKYKTCDKDNPSNRVAIGRYEDTIPYWKVEAQTTTPDADQIHQLPAAWWQAPSSGVARSPDYKYRYIYAGRTYEKSIVVKSSIPYRVRYAVTDDFLGTYYIGYGFHAELSPCDGGTYGIALWDTSGACTATTDLSCFIERPSSNYKDDAFSKITLTTSDGNTSSPSPKSLQTVKPEWVNDQAGSPTGTTHFIQIANSCPNGSWYGYVEYEFNEDCEAGYDSVEETLAVLPVHDKIADAAIILIPFYD